MHHTQVLPKEDNILATGGDDKVYRYAVTVNPTYAKTDAVTIKITVKQFEDQFSKKSADPALKEDAFAWHRRQ